MKKLGSVLAGGILVTATVTGCGSSKSSSTATGSSGGGSGGSATYGVLSCFTGRLASLGQAMMQGAKVAQQEVNDAGGVLGKQVSLVQGDTGCDLADSVPTTQQMLSKGVVGVIGPETQEISAVEPILKGAGIVDEFQGGDTSRDHQTDPLLFRDSPSDSQLGVAMALWAHQKGYQRAALLFYTDAAAQTLIKPIQDTFKKLGGTITTTVSVTPGQTSYAPEVQKVIASNPQVIFTQTDAPTAAVIFRDFQQTNNLAIPFIGTDVTAGSDYLKAVTFPVAHAHLTSVYGTSVTGAGNTEFMNLFTKQNPGQQPLANANYAYDAVISLALADDYAKTFNGHTVAKDMKQVTNPPGTACATYASCLALLKKGTKINYEGASGSLDYNQYNNTFGPYGAFVVDAQGNEQQMGVMSASQLAKATP
ncbi:MAG TPA: ABC transporter substrate-binding protein [Acidimicrobiales bacterium]|nr:ABC transporter substrate-binding protein [Acidimicrobiales bacterium]